MLTYLETTTFHLPKCFDWLIASLFSRLFLFLVFDAENWLKLYFFLNLSIYYEPWCINTIINFILYWSMSWCWQNYMECSLFLPSPGTARADNSFSRHFYFYLTFFIRICNVYCKYYQLILENKLFFIQFQSKIRWKCLIFVMFMSHNFPPIKKPRAKNVCACVVINVILKGKERLFLSLRSLRSRTEGSFQRGYFSPPQTQKKRDKTSLFFYKRGTNFPPSAPFFCIPVKTFSILYCLYTTINIIILVFWYCKHIEQLSCTQS